MVEKIYEGSKVGEARDNRRGDTEWKAASNSARKKRNVDETGLEILGCRHSIAQAAVNMYQGELYGYAHYLQRTFVIPRKVQFLWYDIVGKFWPWVCKHDVAATETVKPALSVIHAKAHSWKCQVICCRRWQVKACGTTGEEVELINSHFSRLGNMLPESRDEVTD